MILFMELCHLSTEYTIRKLNDSDIDRIYDLSRGNAVFYRYHPPFVTKESIREDMRALPPDKRSDDKFYVGFFKGDTLIAIMDFIRDYPHSNVIFIGLFMMDPAWQGRGVGTKIIGDCCAYWKSLGYQKVRLGIDKGNPQSSAFWRKNGFERTGENHAGDAYDYVLMERAL